MDGKKDVSAIWAALKSQQPRPKAGATGGFVSYSAPGAAARAAAPGAPYAGLQRSAAPAAPGAGAAGAGAAPAVIGGLRAPSADEKATAATAQPAPKQAARQQEDACAASGVAAAVAAAAAAGDAAALRQAVVRSANCLADASAERAARKRGAATLRAAFVTEDAGVSPAMFAEVYRSTLAQPLTRALLEDSVESVRVGAFEVIEAALRQAESPAESVLPTLVPVAKARLAPPLAHAPQTAGADGSLSTAALKRDALEPSEELRLGLVRAFGGPVLERCDVAQIEPFVDDLLLIARRCMSDHFPDVKKAACALSAGVAARAPGPAAHSAAAVAAAALSALGHQHSRVRVAALQATHCAISSASTAPAALAIVQGNGSAKNDAKGAAPGVSPAAASLTGGASAAVRALGADRSPAVRECAIVAAAAWMGHAPDADVLVPMGVEASAATLRHELSRADAAALLPLLLPSLLLALSDEAETVRVRALALLDGVGGAVASLPDAVAGVQGMDLDTAAEAAAGDETDAAMADAGEDSEQQQSGVDEGAESWLPLVEGEPPTARPVLRTLVRSVLRALVDDALAQLREWTPTARLCGARLLRACAACAGKALEAHLDTVVPALASAVADDDAAVAAAVAAAAEAVGAVCAPHAWVPLATELAAGERAAPAQRASALVVVAALLRAAPARGSARAVGATEVSAIATTLAAEDVRCSEHAGVRTQLSAAAAALVAAAPHAFDSSDANSSGGAEATTVALFRALVGVANASADSEAVPASARRTATTTMRSLALAWRGMEAASATEGEGEAALTELYLSHAAPLLSEAIGTAALWSGGAPEAESFVALVEGCAAHAALSPHVPAVVDALARALEKERDAGLRLSLLQLLERLLAGAAAPAFGVLTRRVLRELCLPSAQWAVGRSAAAVRYAAVAAIARLVASPTCDARALAELLTADAGNSELWGALQGALDEHYYSDTRLAAAQCISAMLQLTGAAGLTDDLRRKVYPELVKRLDDASDDVRMGACAALVAFWEATPADYCDANSEYCAAGVVVHMDDPDARMQEAACRVLEAAARRKPKQVREVVQQARHKHRAPHYCDRVVAACDAAT